MPAEYATVDVDMDNVYTDRFPGPSQVVPPMNLAGAPAVNAPGNVNTDALLQILIGISQCSVPTNNFLAQMLNPVTFGQAIFTSY
jgi:hypothetical protein